MNLIRNLQGRYRRGFLALASMTGITCAELGGCDNTAVTSTVLSGLQDLAITLVEVFFIAIAPTEETVTPVTTWLIDGLQYMLT